MKTDTNNALWRPTIITVLTVSDDFEASLIRRIEGRNGRSLRLEDGINADRLAEAAERTGAVVPPELVTTYRRAGVITALMSGFEQFHSPEDWELASVGRVSRDRERNRGPDLAQKRGTTLACGVLPVLNRPRASRQGHRRGGHLPGPARDLHRALRRREILQPSEWVPCVIRFRCDCAPHSQPKNRGAVCAVEQPQKWALQSRKPQNWPQMSAAIDVFLSHP